MDLQSEKKLPALQKHQEQILSALRATVKELSIEDHLTIVGSLGRYLAEEADQFRDIDIWINETVCKRFWEFTKSLTACGLKPVWNLWDPPDFPWNACYVPTGHPAAFTADCSENAKGLAGKHANLDIYFSKENVALIPQSKRWVEVRGLNEKELKEKIVSEHEFFLGKRPTAPQNLTSRRKHEELGLFFVGK